MKITINNHTKDLTDSICITKVYQFLNDSKILEDFEIFNDIMTITFTDYVCYVRRLGDGFSFRFLNLIKGEQQ